jgi:hypothetical protein
MGNGRAPIEGRQRLISGLESILSAGQHPSIIENMMMSDKPLRTRDDLQKIVVL